MTPDAAAAVGMVRGALENVGGRMKSAGTQYWLAQNAGGTNESGFSGLPSGGRNALGEFTQQGVLGIWWSATESDALSAYDRILLDGEAGVARNTADKRFGFPVRCLRD
jgi:uncharacterized protein (TIGR02145 family)